VLVEGHRWRDVRAVEGCAVVRDAGLTEVAPGTETVVALAPGVAFV
jgi:peptidyl-tRNA hydrolase